MDSNKIYIIGHKSPDLDSVAAAIAMAEFKNRSHNSDNHIPVMAGEPNKETVFALEKFGLSKPEILSGAAGLVVFLVDHNEISQAVDGANEAKISGIVDHHKFDFKYSEPIFINCRPWGATCTIIKSTFDKNNMEIGKELAGLMLSAILVDTVITKSPTTTDFDRKAIEELAKLAGIDDWRSYGLELFKVRSNVKELPPMEIIKSDFKDFNFKRGKFGIGQVETVDLGEFAGGEDELLSELEKLKDAEGYHSVILFITDIMKEGSLFLVATNDQEAIEKTIGHQLENGRVFIDGIISRKKQVAPLFMENFDK
jgi:manganese-dependent inorganic pyrophosphatase